MTLRNLLKPKKSQSETPAPKKGEPSATPNPSESWRCEVCGNVAHGERCEVDGAEQPK